MRVKFRLDPKKVCGGGDFSTPFQEGEYIGFTLNGEVAIKLDDGTIHSYCVKAYEIIMVVGNNEEFETWYKRKWDYAHHMHTSKEELKAAWIAARESNGHRS